LPDQLQQKSPGPGALAALATLGQVFGQSIQSVRAKDFLDHQQLICMLLIAPGRAHQLTWFLARRRMPIRSQLAGFNVGDQGLGAVTMFRGVSRCGLGLLRLARRFRRHLPTPLGPLAVHVLDLRPKVLVDAGCLELRRLRFLGRRHWDPHMDCGRDRSLGADIDTIAQPGQPRPEFAPEDQ
jgi:hypothetical protein